MRRAFRALPSRSLSRLPLALALGAGVCAASLGCSGGAAGEEVVPADEVVPLATPLPAPAPSIYDEDGKLLPSERVLGGLTLPLGLENEQQGAGRHLFEARVPAEKLVQYLGPRLFTGEVEQHGNGASFLGATPLRPSGTAYRMDVLVTERGPTRSALLIRIADAPTARPSEPTEADLRDYHERLD
ncbi:MAG: hypothetical protein KC593_04930 [Myxococcales bacterium]|nr:hypothetical protein [Myxococcales bacterium]MCB9630171.1 hypothetical protein [Sandaracinaceae bacterium]